MTLAELLQVALGPLLTGGAVWLAIRVELRWLRADVNRHEEELKVLRHKAAGVR